MVSKEANGLETGLQDLRVVSRSWPQSPKNDFDSQVFRAGLSRLGTLKLDLGLSISNKDSYFPRLIPIDYESSQFLLLMRSSVLFPRIQIDATTLIKPPLVTIIKCVSLFCGIYTNSIALITSLFSRIFSPLASKSNCKSRENITKYEVLQNLFNANTSILPGI